MSIVVDFINKKFAPAVGSAIVWAAFWGLSFYIFTFVLFKLGLSTETSALVITATVISGHIPKLISFIIDTDTDFRRSREWDITNLSWSRLIIALGLLGFLTIYLIPGYVSTMAPSFEPSVMPELVNHTWLNFPICLSLFSLQVVFSWPDLDVMAGQPI